MKIINAMFSKVNGGLEQAFLRYGTTLLQEGNTVLNVIHPKAQIKSYCPPENLKTIHNFNQFDPIAVFKLNRLLNKEKPDCIIIHSYRAAYLFQKTKASIPKIAVCHVKGHYDFGTDALIALTESMRQEIIASGKPAERVFTVPNMLTSEELPYKVPQKKAIPVLGVCARFVPIKGVDIFIHALSELKKRKIQFRAKIAGDGPEKPAYLNLIREHNLENEVTFLGWVEDRHAFYQSLDIFCLPSREEAFGLVVLESMQHSLPMVLTALSGPLEIMGTSQAALIVPPENPVQMAAALEQIILNHELATKLSLGAFERVQTFSSKKVGPILQQAITKVVNLA